MPQTKDNLAAQFNLEVKSRQRDRTVRRTMFFSLIAVLIVVGISFIPDPNMRRLIGLPMLGVVLAIKGLVSYQTWKFKNNGATVS